MNMKKSFFYMLVLLTPLSVLWAPKNPECNKSDFSCYIDWRDNHCRSPDNGWNDSTKYPDLGKVTNDYAEFTSQGQNAQMSKIISSEIYPSEKTKLQKELDPKRIGTFRGYKTAEIARIQYRNNMNKIFSCSVSASRIQVVTQLQKLIQQAGSKEINEKLKKDIQKLKLNSPKNCSPTSSDTMKSYPAAIVRSATTEYCSYLFYNEYLEAQIDQNQTQVFEIESKIGEWWENASLPSNMWDYANLFTSYSDQIQSNIARAQSTLPKALVAYREMERTYGVHIMLMIIYDDYLTLGQNLSTYLSAVSQFFEKVENAMSANN